MKKIITLFLMLAICSVSFADNALMNYFRKWVDETRVELAIGKLILGTTNDELKQNMAAYHTQQSKSLANTFIPTGEGGEEGPIYRKEKLLPVK